MTFEPAGLFVSPESAFTNSGKFNLPAGAVTVNDRPEFV
jgi:hypothetical protein